MESIFQYSELDSSFIAIQNWHNKFHEDEIKQMSLGQCLRQNTDCILTILSYCKLNIKCLQKIHKTFIRELVVFDN